MRKRYLSIIAVFVFLWSSPASAATNYCEDPDARLCALMEDTGNESDESGNGETLTETGGTIALDTVDFKFGLASRDFEAGDTEFLLHADGGSTDISGANQSMCIALWVKHETVPATGIMRYVTKYNVTGNQRQYALSYSATTNDAIFTLSNDGTSIDSAEGATDLNAAEWYHVAASYDDTDMRLYLNGVLDANGSVNPQAWTTGIHAGTAAFNIGRQDGSSTVYFDGKIDDVIILARSCTVDEINEMMNCGVTGEGTAPGCQAVAGDGSTIIRGSTLRGVIAH